MLFKDIVSSRFIREYSKDVCKFITYQDSKGVYKQRTASPMEHLILSNAIRSAIMAVFLNQPTADEQTACDTAEYLIIKLLPEVNSYSNCYQHIKTFFFEYGENQ